jgi:hypothetical protein
MLPDEGTPTSKATSFFNLTFLTGTEGDPKCKHGNNLIKDHPLLKDHQTRMVLYILEGVIVDGWNVLGLRKGAFEVACQHGAQRPSAERGLWYEDHNLIITLFFSTEEKAVMTYNALLHNVERTRVHISLPCPAHDVPQLQYVVMDDYVQGDSPQPRTPSNSTAIPAPNALSTCQSFEVLPQSCRFAQCHIVPRKYLEESGFCADNENFLLAMSSNVHDSFDGKLRLYTIPYILILPLGIEKNPPETIFDFRDKVTVRIYFLDGVHEGITFPKGTQQVDVSPMFGMPTFAVETHFFPPDGQLFADVLKWRFDVTNDAWQMSSTVDIGTDGKNAWYRLVPLGFLETRVKKLGVEESLAKKRK